MDERMRFVVAAKEKRLSMRALCELFGIAPKTGYKWVARYGLDGIDGLREQSRRPRSNSRAICQDVADRLIEAREKHPTWGALKLLAWLEARSGKRQWPAASTVTALLRRHHLVTPRQRTQPRAARATPLAVPNGPNAVWAMDFKGYFLVGDGERCDPLTVTDGFSRFLLCCEALPNQRGVAVREALIATFRRYGLPAVFRSDNGAPFGAPSHGLISNLAVWLVRLGVRPEYIDPGKPQQNGRHERMHLTLKQDTAQPPAENLKRQQDRFKNFRHLYNYERPHQALGQKPPDSIYTPSLRTYPRRLPEVEYPGHFHRRQVKQCGDIKWLGHLVRLTSSLRGQTIGLNEVGDGSWQLFFGPLLLGRFHSALPHLGLVRLPPKVLPMSPV